MCKDAVLPYFRLAYTVDMTRDAAISFANDKSVYTGFRQLLVEKKFSNRVITAITKNPHSFADTVTLEFLKKLEEQEAY